MFGLISASECKILILFGTGAKNKSALVAGNPSARCRGLLGECHCCLPPPSVTDGLWISQLSGLVPVSFSGLENRVFKCFLHRTGSCHFLHWSKAPGVVCVTPRGLGSMWKWDILNLQVGDWECFEMGPELSRGGHKFCHHCSVLSLRNVTALVLKCHISSDTRDKCL